jgi:O-antigen/teichoic acid export membrane protein
VIARLSAMLTGPRAWLTLGMLLPRASGFLTGLLLARLGGAATVGVYSTVMNTAAPLVAPLSHALINNNTLMAGEMAPGGLRGLWRANALILAAAVVLGLPAFAWLYARAAPGPEVPGLEAWHLGWALLGATAVFISQFGTPTAAALLHGEGRFRKAGQLAVATGLVGLLGVWPVVQAFGLIGAIALAALVAALGWALVAFDLLSRHGRAPAHPPPLAGPIARRLRQALPAMAGMGLNGAVNWLCMILITSASWQADGVGVVGIALQWSTLMLIPATSWGGMNLQKLGESHRAGDAATLWSTVGTLLRRNAGVTAVAALVVALSSGLLEQVYGLRGSGLAPTLCAFAAAAVVTSANAVLEKYWWAAGRQGWWFAWGCAGLATQLCVTLWLVPRHVGFAGVGVLSYGLVLCALSLLALRRDLSQRVEAGA